MAVMPRPIPARSPTRLRTSTFRRLALGIDFSTASLGAARWVTNHLAPGAELVAVHVVPFPDGAPYSLSVDATRERALRHLVPSLAGGLGGFAATLAAESARSVVRIGGTSRAIIGVAEASRAELVVLGRRARGRRQAIDEPNVIERVARDVLAPVLVVPEGEHPPVRRVLVAVDDGDWAPRVLREGRELSRLMGAELTVLHVVSDGYRAYERLARSGTGEGAGTTVSERETADARVRDWLRGLASRAAGESPAVELASGEPGRAIVRAARTLNPGLVVIGKRGVHGAPAGSLGSSAREVLAHAPGPVLALEFDDPEQGVGVEPAPRQARGHPHPHGHLHLVDGHSHEEAE